MKNAYITISSITMAFHLFFFSTVNAQVMTFSGHGLPPYFFNNNGVVSGAFVDTLDTICKRLKHQCTFKINSVQRVEAGVKEGVIDGWIVGLDPSRDTFLIQPQKWFKMKLSFLGLATSNFNINSIQDINKFTVAVTKGSTSMNILEKIYVTSGLNSPIIKETTMPVMIKKIQSGRYGQHSLLFGPEPVLIAIGKELNVPIKSILSIESYSLGVGFSKKTVHPDVANSFNQQFEIMKKNGELDKIEKLWFP